MPEPPVRFVFWEAISCLRCLRRVKFERSQSLREAVSSSFRIRRPTERQTGPVNRKCNRSGCLLLPLLLLSLAVLLLAAADALHHHQAAADVRPKQTSTGLPTEWDDSQPSASRPNRHRSQLTLTLKLVAPSLAGSPLRGTTACWPTTCVQQARHPTDHLKLNEAAFGCLEAGGVI